MALAFVTGGTGFVGQHLVARLAADGWDVVALYRPGADTRPLRAAGVTLRAGRLTEAAEVLATMPERPDAVFHVAGSTSLWRGDAAEQTRVNVAGTRHVVDAALARGARRLVHTSSIAAYGTLAYRAAGFDEATPSDAARHWVCYLRTKWLGEQEVRRGAERGLEVVLLNPANVLGPGDRHNWSQLFALLVAGKLPGVPPGRGSWCDVREVAAAHVAAAARGRPGENYLLGGVDASYADVTAMAAELTGVRAPRPLPAWALRAVGRVNQWGSALTRRAPDVTPEAAFLACGVGTVDSAKAERDLGFRAVPLRPLVADTLAWMRAEGLLGGAAARA
jgi:nucleoside-diphosphate-sugar epimerase